MPRRQHILPLTLTLDVLADKGIVHDGATVALENFLKLANVIRLVGTRGGNVVNANIRSGKNIYVCHCGPPDEVRHGHNLWVVAVGLGLL